MGTLNVYMYTPTGSKRLWSKSGNQGQQWLSASITVVSKEPLSIVFEAVRGVAYASDIAIDDISYLDGSCEEQTTPSTVGLITQPPTPGERHLSILLEIRKSDIDFTQTVSFIFGFISLFIVFCLVI